MKKNQGASAGPSAAVPSGDKFGVAAKRLLDASFSILASSSSQVAMLKTRVEPAKAGKREIFGNEVL